MEQYAINAVNRVESRLIAIWNNYKQSGDVARLDNQLSILFTDLNNNVASTLKAAGLSKPHPAAKSQWVYDLLDDVLFLVELVIDQYQIFNNVNQ